MLLMCTVIENFPIKSFNYTYTIRNEVCFGWLISSATGINLLVSALLNLAAKLLIQTIKIASAFSCEYTEY